MVNMLDILGRRIWLLIFFTLPAFAASKTEPWRVSFDGYGPIRIGMTPLQASKVLGVKLESENPKRTDSCYYAYSNNLPGVFFMVTDGKIARIDVDSPTVIMDSGAKIGNSIEEIIQLYQGRIKIDRHTYTGPEGKYLTVSAPNGLHGVRFETDSITGRVDVFYAGKFSEIQFPEGCF